MPGLLPLDPAGAALPLLQADLQHQSNRSHSLNALGCFPPPDLCLCRSLPGIPSIHRPQHLCPSAPHLVFKASPSRKSSLTLSHIDSICSFKKNLYRTELALCGDINQSFSLVDAQVVGPCGLVPLSIPSQEPFGDRACGSSRCPPRMPNKVT